jgi:hypothetical protein
MSRLSFCLPVAMASILVARCLSAYFLLAFGTIHVVLVLLVLVFFDGDAVA